MIDHSSLIGDPDVPLGAAADPLAGFVARRLRHEPISRILGRREFWGLSFAVTPAVLDPRPETEGLVASVVDALGGRRDEGLDILDLGIGSGAILGALLRELPTARGVGIDRSLDACQTARRNLSSIEVISRAAVICGNWSAAVRGRFDVIVSNPPYIVTADIDDLARDVRDHDPRLALDGGSDGLQAYHAIIPGLSELAAPGAIVAFECGAGQGADVAALMCDEGLVGAAVYLDLAGHDRVVIGLNPS
jgi:release factor glutamine methyltransferase